ncbi:MAG: hypothetical protein EPO32_12720 [Anaerolineae bacterium]|nr:MAG: hypothetical protein EPO32_12720 [Anaerolineae bacterium]
MRQRLTPVLAWLKRFFFPPAGSPRWLRVLPYAVMGLLTVLVLAGGTAGWTYTNSSEFCGTACHTMPPEYSAYLISPHARVQCVECHIGRDVITTQFTRKAGDLRHVVLNITKQYEYPIRAVQMRPARESCETCHFPEKFSDDSLRELRRYQTDEANSIVSTFLVLKTGGGTGREGLGYGIHWHVESDVYYLANDSLEQEISYVRVVDKDGNVTEFYDLESGIGPEDVAGQTLVQMDCITCHNRITHKVSKPQDAVSNAITKGLISSELPFVVRESVALLTVEYPDKESATEAMTALAGFYEQNYPDVFASQQEDIQQAILSLQEIYAESVFPEQKSDWDSHPNNLGHKYDPGCFRCHDGKHVTQTGEAIRLECNLCHAIPVVVEGSQQVTQIEVLSGPQPYSHTHSSWIALHDDAIDTTCASCHPPTDPETDLTALTGTPPVDGSFCGNAACHGSGWVYAGFDSPALQPVLERELYQLKNTSPFLTAGNYTYEDVFRNIFEARCTACHSGPEASAGLDLNSYRGLLTGSRNGPVVDTDAPAASVMVVRQEAGGHFGQMLADEIEALLSWITAGLPEK